MCQSSKLHHRPSLIIESMAWPWPSRSPSRAPGSRYGQLLIDSMPPATTTSASPAAIALGGQHHSLQPRSAHLVDRERRDAIAQPASQRRLSRGSLAETG